MEKEREVYIGEDGLEYCLVCNEPFVVVNVNIEML